MQLRPSNLGEILERALALYARNFGRLFVLSAAAIVPVAIVQYLLLLRARPQLDATLDILQHPERLRTEHVASLFDSPAMLAIVIATVLFGYYVLAFGFGAVAISLDRLYRGETVEFWACYLPVLRRWTSIVTLVGVAILALVTAYCVTIVIVAIPVFAAALALQWFAVIAPFALAAVLCLISFALLCTIITGACALGAIVIEGLSASWALRITILRLFNRREFGRAMLCAFFVGTIALFVSTIVDSGGFLVLSNWPAAYETVDAFERIILMPLLALVLTAYYFDVRLRYEGFDFGADHGLAAAPDEPVYAPTAYLSGEERAPIKRFLERRDSLEPGRRRQIAAQLAAPARTRVPPELQVLDDESLLERIG